MIKVYKIFILIFLDYDEASISILSNSVNMEMSVLERYNIIMVFYNLNIIQDIIQLFQP